MDGSLEGQLLIAMPAMGDPRFDRTVLFMCAHSEDGAMGLIVNKPAEQITFASLLEQLDIEVGGNGRAVRVHYGGPVEVGRGFVLHTPDFEQDSTVIVGDGFALTATIDVLRAIAEGRGPKHGLLALGYAGWAPGQLDQEIQQNAWLHAPADPDIVFDGRLETKWERALRVVGVDPSFLSTAAGHA